MLRLGLLTPEQAANHPGRSILTRTVGTDPIVQIDLARHPVQAGDTFVLCSDGLWDSVARGEMAEQCGAIGSPGVPTVTQAADLLVDLALKRGAPDNVTICLVRVTSDRAIPSAGVRRSLFRRGWR
jgi:serine/threonine protein phosphatase PrpC